MSIFEERLEYKPFQYGHITDPLIDAMTEGHWTHKEFTFARDVQDFHTAIDAHQQEVLRRTILLISQVEIAVKTYWGNIGNLLPKPEIADMGAIFGGIEVIHSRAYSHILTKLGLEDDFKLLFNEPVIEGRIRYLKKHNEKIYDNNKKQVCYSLALFTLFTENVSLFSQFYIILAFNRFNALFKDVANVVNYSALEENLHAQGGIMLLNQIKKEEPELFDEELIEKITSEAKEAIRIESELIAWILHGYDDEYISQDLLETFIKLRMNNAMIDIGLPTLFELDEHLIDKVSWMDEEICAGRVVDFFDGRPTEYNLSRKSFDEEDLF